MNTNQYNTSRGLYQDAPIPLAPQFESIPLELQQGKKFVLWRYAWNGQKWEKPPFQTSSYPASKINPLHWNTFENVRQVYLNGNNAGIGRTIEASDPYTCLDLDDCFQPNGQLQEWAFAIVKQFNSYTERSPSGFGIKLWIRGTARNFQHKNKGDDISLEVLSQAMYGTLTGHSLRGTPPIIYDRQSALDALQQRLHKCDVSGLGGGVTMRQLHVSPHPPSPNTSRFFKPAAIRAHGGLIWLQKAYETQSPKLLRKAGYWLADYVKKHPQQADRSTYFQGLVNATCLAWSPDMCWSLRKEIDALSGQKYGASRIDVETRRSIEKAKNVTEEKR